MNTAISGHAFGQPIFDGKMIKKALFALPGGAFLASNCLLSPDVPLVAEHVPNDMDQRELLWKKLRHKELPGTLFYAFESAKEYQTWLRFRFGRLSLA